VPLQNAFRQRKRHVLRLLGPGGIKGYRKDYAARIAFDGKSFSHETEVRKPNSNKKKAENRHGEVCADVDRPSSSGKGGALEGDLGARRSRKKKVSSTRQDEKGEKVRRGQERKTLINTPKTGVLATRKSEGGLHHHMDTTEGGKEGKELTWRGGNGSRQAEKKKRDFHTTEVSASLDGARGLRLRPAA